MSKCKAGSFDDPVAMVAESMWAAGIISTVSLVLQVMVVVNDYPRHPSILMAWGVISALMTASVVSGGKLGFLAGIYFVYYIFSTGNVLPAIVLMVLAVTNLTFVLWVTLMLFPTRQEEPDKPVDTVVDSIKVNGQTYKRSGRGRRSR